MTTSTSPSLEEQVTRLQARIDAMEGDRRQTSRRRGIRMALGVITIAALLAVPIGVFASHQFTDVPDSNTFHTQIGRVKGAGITAGCTATKYCPDDTVTRGQMAAFLARTGGRVTMSPLEGVTGGVLSTSAASPTVLATVTIKAGDVTGGYANVTLDGVFTAYANSATGLPSIAWASVRQVGSGVRLSGGGFVQVDGIAGGTAGAGTAPVLGVVTVPTGVAQSFELVAYRIYGSATMNGFATLTATYVPFAGDGTNAGPVAAPPKASSEKALQP